MPTYIQTNGYLRSHISIPLKRTELFSKGLRPFY